MDDRQKTQGGMVKFRRRFATIFSLSPIASHKSSSAKKRGWRERRNSFFLRLIRAPPDQMLCDGETICRMKKSNRAGCIPTAREVLPPVGIGRFRQHRGNGMQPSKRLLDCDTCVLLQRRSSA
jgi:hypothetical protein